MARRKDPTQLIHLTFGKMVRLVVFVALTGVGFLLSANVPSFGGFGWGYFFGLAGMAVLLG